MKAYLEIFFPYVMMTVLRRHENSLVSVSEKMKYKKICI